MANKDALFTALTFFLTHTLLGVPSPAVVALRLWTVTEREDRGEAFVLVEVADGFVPRVHGHDVANNESQGVFDA